MLNKKILAAAVAATLSTGAFAADLDAASTGVTYSSELAPQTQTMTVNVAGELNSTVELGFTIGDGTSKYVRYDLVNATFGPNVALTVPDLSTDVGGNPNPQTINARLAVGGEGESFVLFEIVANGADISPEALVSLTADSYDVSTAEASTIQYRLYETATQATNLSDNLKDTGAKVLSTVGTGLTGNIFVPNNVESLLETEFKEFDGGLNGGLTATLGHIDTSKINQNAVGAPNGVLAPATGLQVVATDLFTANDEDFILSFAGDFSFGDWVLDDDASCDTASDIFDFTEVVNGEVLDVLSHALSAAEITGGKQYLCVTVDGNEIINKGAYSSTVESADRSSVSLIGDLGIISYDTITVEIPYVSTFAGYNQRLILRNTSSTPVDFTISFDTETGTTANTAGKEAGGTIPANGVLVKKMTDFVAFEGKSRGSATVEIEGLEANIQAATQIVNQSTGATDTTILNANSVTAFVPQP